MIVIHQESNYLICVPWPRKPAKGKNANTDEIIKMLSLAIIETLISIPQYLKNNKSIHTYIK